MHDDSNYVLIRMYPMKWLLNVCAGEMYPINMQLCACHWSIFPPMLYSNCTEKLNKHTLGKLHLGVVFLFLLLEIQQGITIHQSAVYD